MSSSPLAPAAGRPGSTGKSRAVSSGSPSPAARRRALALVALLFVPSSAWALEAHEVLRYEVFSGRPGGVVSGMAAAVARDGGVLLAWNVARPAERLEAVRAQWLGPDGTPLGESFVAVRDARLSAVAARSGRQALILSSSRSPNAGYRLTVVNGEGVVERRNPAAFGCEHPSAVTATERGYFLACLDFAAEPWRFLGWWLSETGRPGKQVEIGPGSAIRLAGGLGQGVLALYRGDDAPLLARWMTPWKQGPPVVVDDRAGRFSWGASVAHLRDRVFGVAWLRVYEPIPEPDPDAGEAKITAIHAATFRAPDLVRSDRRFSELSGSLEDAPDEQTRPLVLRTAARQQVIGWFGCRYQFTPGALFCWEQDGLFLRARVGARPSGEILELADVAAYSIVVFTGERLLTVSSGEVRVFALE